MADASVTAIDNSGKEIRGQAVGSCLNVRFGTPSEPGLDQIAAGTVTVPRPWRCSAC